MGKIEEGLEELNKAEAMMRKTGGRFYEEELHRIRGELLLHQEAHDEGAAEASFRRAIAVAARKKAKSLELRLAISLSRLLHKQGKGEEAQSLLLAVYSWFTEGFDTADLREAKALLDELE
jgi:predicted ATPase